MPRDTKAIRTRVQELARKDERRGDWKSALRRYTRLTGLEPDDPALHIKLGDVHLRLGEVDGAVDAFWQAAQLFTRTSFDDKAAALYKRALELDPGRAEVRTALIGAYRRLDRIPEAIGLLKEASERADDRGDMQEALDLRRQIAELDPLDVETRLRLAHDLERVGNPGEALHEYAESLLELLRQRSFERAVGVSEAIHGMRPQPPPDAADDAPAVDGEDRLVAHAQAARNHFEEMRSLYQRVALLYHRERGLP